MINKTLLKDPFMSIRYKSYCALVLMFALLCGLGACGVKPSKLQYPDSKTNFPQSYPKEVSHDE
jgi:hypothetical protein